MMFKLINYQQFFRFQRCYSTNVQRISNEITKLGVLGVPSSFGQGKEGVNNGPSVIRAAGLIETLKNDDSLDVKDYGDVHINKIEDLNNTVNVKRFPQVISVTRDTSALVKQILNDGRVCVTLGGDHSIALGTVHGHLLHNPDIALLWVDAHADINTHSTSSSGNMHGMPLSLLTEETKGYWPEHPDMNWIQKSIPAKNIAYIGLRSVDAYERVFIDNLGIAAYCMSDIEKHGIDGVMRMALNKINPTGNRSLHVSFDIDSLDPNEAPSTGTPVRGGLSIREGIHIMETCKASGALKALDLVEVNPMIGKKNESNRTVDAAIEIIGAAFLTPREGIKKRNLLNMA